MGLPACGEVPEENLLRFFLALECRLWEGLCEGLGCSQGGLLDPVRLVAGKNPLKDFSALGNWFRVKSSALVRRGVDELNYGVADG